MFKKQKIFIEIFKTVNFLCDAKCLILNLLFEHYPILLSLAFNAFNTFIQTLKKFLQNQVMRTDVQRKFICIA